jgi:hypothetical protein
MSASKPKRPGDNVSVPMERPVFRTAGMYQGMADSHPSLRRGMVWCRSCGHSQKVDSADCLKKGWPKCCGFTMTIDAPGEQSEIYPSVR